MLQIPYLLSFFDKDINEIIFEKENKYLKIFRKKLNNQNTGIYKFSLNNGYNFTLNLDIKEDVAFLLDFEKNHKINSKNDNEKYIEFLFNDFKIEKNKQIMNKIKNTEIFTDNELYHIISEKIFYLDSNNLQYLLTLDFMQKKLEDLITINYVMENKQKDIESLLTELFKNNETKYIPIVNIVEELKKNNWFKKCDSNELFNILMKENYNSYSKISLLKEFANKILFINEDNYSKDELSTFILNKTMGRDKDEVEDLLSFVDDKNKLDDFLNVFNHKEVIYIMLLDKNPEYILNNSPEDSEIKKELQYVLNNICFWSEMFKCSSLEMIKNVSDEELFTKLKEIEYNIVEYLKEEKFGEIWLSIMNEDFFQRIILKNNIENF